MSSHYRAFEPIIALTRNGRGHSGWINDVNGDVAPEMADADVALISRWQGIGAQKLAESLHRAGIAVVWGHDDAVELNPTLKSGALQLQKTQAEIRAMLKLADGVVTTSEVIAERYREMGGDDVRVIENYLGEHYADLERRPHTGLIVGWAAWIDHQADWKALGLHETFTRLLATHPHLHVASVGMVDLQLPRDRYSRSPEVPFEQLGQALTSFDVGIAPIVDHAFNRARSNIKLKEYAAAGIPWLASPIGPYADLGEKQGGRLVPDDGWYDALDDLIRNERARRKLAKRARKWASEQMLSKHTDKWEAALTEAIERRRRAR